MFLSAVLNWSGSFDHAKILRVEVITDSGITLMLHRLTILQVAIGFVANRPIVRRHLGALLFDRLLVERLLSVESPRPFPVVRIIDGNVPVDPISSGIAGKGDKI